MRVHSNATTNRNQRLRIQSDEGRKRSCAALAGNSLVPTPPCIGGSGATAPMSAVAEHGYTGHVRRMGEEKLVSDGQKRDPAR